MEPSQFTERFSSMLKQLNRNIIRINGIEYYQIPVQTIRQLEALYNLEMQGPVDPSIYDESDEDVSNGYVPIL